MTQVDELLATSVRRFALAVAALVALALPSVYALISYRDFTDALDFKARIKASALVDSIAANPATWMYAENRLTGIIARQPIPLRDEQVEVFDSSGELLARAGNAPAAPVLGRTYPLYDADREVGRIVVSGSLHPLARPALASLILGLLLALLVFAVLKTLPLRALGRATSALTASERRFREIFENVPNIAVQGYDANRHAIYWNAASERIYGYDAGEALGARMEDLIVAEPLRARAVAAVSGMLQDGPPVFAGELTQMRKDGSPITVFSSRVVLSDGAARRDLYCLDIELTELKRTEAELREYQTRLEQKVEERTLALSIAKEAAETANRAKGTFLANMSHELRTPMNAIMGMTSLALRRAEDPKLREHLKRIDQASRHLLALIEDILDLARIDAERFTLSPVDFTLEQVWNDLRNLVDDRIAEKRLHLATDMPEEIARMPLRGDPLRLRQILLNLVGNAIKFTESGGLGVRMRVTDESAPEIGLRIDVRDTGIGIAIADQERIFAAFEQADGSMTRRFGGSGLGLAISRKLARMMGGDISLASEPGRGSTFSLSLRLARASGTHNPAALPTESRPSAAEDLAAHAGARILVAEDDPAGSEAVVELLGAVGLRVDTVADGAAALEHARHARYDLILMDVHMPVLSGIDATRAIRALPGRETTPILALTADAFDENRKRCLAAGMDDYLAKPVAPEDLYAAVLRWLRRR